MNLKTPLLFLNFFFIIFVVVYLYATGGPIPGGDFPDEGIYLFHEKFLGSLFSSIQILAISLLALANTLFCRYRNAGRECCFWAASFLAFFFFSLDEYFLIHENLDHWLIKILHLPKNRITDKIDDLLVLLYGVTAVVVLVQSWGWLSQHTRFLAYARVGFVFLFLMVFFDIASLKLFPVKELEEDALKLFAEAYFLLAYASPLIKERAPAAAAA